MGKNSFTGYPYQTTIAITNQADEGDDGLSGAGLGLDEDSESAGLPDDTPVKSPSEDDGIPEDLGDEFEKGPEVE